MSILCEKCSYGRGELLLTNVVMGEENSLWPMHIEKIVADSKAMRALDLENSYV